MSWPHKHSQLHFNTDHINEDDLYNFGCLLDIFYLLIYLTFFENKKKTYTNIHSHKILHKPYKL